jgi:hypothetical protein
MQNGAELPDVSDARNENAWFYGMSCTPVDVFRVIDNGNTQYFIDHYRGHGHVADRQV